MILASLIEKFSLYCLIRSWQDLTKMYQEFFPYQDLGKITHVLSRLSRSCMSWQGVSSFVSLVKDTVIFCPVKLHAHLSILIEIGSIQIDKIFLKMQWFFHVYKLYVKPCMLADITKTYQ